MTMILQTLGAAAAAGALAFVACPGSIRLSSTLADCIERDRHIEGHEIGDVVRACVRSGLGEDLALRLMLSAIVAMPVMIHGATVVGAVHAAAFALVAMLMIADARTGQLPPALTGSLLWLGLLAPVAVPWLDAFWPLFPSDAILGAAVGWLTVEGSAFFLAMARQRLGEEISMRDLIGGGDAKMVLGMGALLGMAPVLIAVSVASALALAPFFMLKADERSSWRLRLAPFLGIAALIAHAADVAGLIS